MNRYAIACPEGHTEDLELRVLVDSPPTVDPEGLLHPQLSAPEAEVQSRGDRSGVDSGVWCPTCEEWYPEAECVHPVDDVGNAEVPSLGDGSPRRPEGSCTILRRPFAFDGRDVVDRDGEHVARAVNPGMARLLAEAYNVNLRAAVRKAIASVVTNWSPAQIRDAVDHALGSS